MFSPVEQAPPLGRPNFEYRGLFADHSLRDPQRLRALEEGKRAEGLEPAFKKIREVYLHRGIHCRPQTNEAQTEKDCIRPVLDILWGGDNDEVQAPIPHIGTPDYAFFRSPDARREAEKHKGTGEVWREVPVLGDAKAWGSSLDRTAGTGGNPAAQISNDLHCAHGRWGILTNGRLWRLYEVDKSRTGGVYFEVRLDEIEGANLEAFKCFYLFFRRQAFLADAQTGLSFVEKGFKESTEYIIEVGQGLKNAVYDAMRHLMNGFFTHTGNALDRSNSDHLRQVHENSLILLYRLLFILYAEDREILPRQRPPYETYSLRTLRKETNARLLRRPELARQKRLFHWELEFPEVFFDKLLAYLAEQMIGMNKEKQTGTKGCLAWLERHIGAKVDSLAGRTKLRASSELDFGALLEIVQQNRRRLGKPFARAVEEDIEREFQNSTSNLRPLLDRIAATDRLIDLIVYRRYGLTDEEVAIVEGMTPFEINRPNA